MLGGACTNKIFFAENLKRSLYKKALLTHYISDMTWHDMTDMKKFFSLKILDGTGSHMLL